MNAADLEVIAKGTSVALIPIFKRQDAEIAALRARIEVLEKQFETKDRKNPTHGGKR